MPFRRNNLANWNKSRGAVSATERAPWEQTPPRSGICRNFPTFPHWGPDVLQCVPNGSLRAAIFSAGRLKVRTMDNRRFRFMTPAEKAAFLADKETRFLETLARELDLLDPASKRSEQCFQTARRGRPVKGSTDRR